MPPIGRRNVPPQPEGQEGPESTQQLQPGASSPQGVQRKQPGMSQPGAQISAPPMPASNGMFQPLGQVPAAQLAQPAQEFGAYGPGGQPGPEDEITRLLKGLLGNGL